MTTAEMLEIQITDSTPTINKRVQPINTALYQDHAMIEYVESPQNFLVAGITEIARGWGSYTHVVLGRSQYAENNICGGYVTEYGLAKLTDEEVALLKS